MENGTDLIMGMACSMKSMRENWEKLHFESMLFPGSTINNLKKVYTQPMLVGHLSIFYRYFYGHCSQEIRDNIPIPLRLVRTTRSSLIRTLSKLHCLIDHLYPTNYHSSLENAIY